PRSRLLAWAPRLAAAAAVLFVAWLVFWPGGEARAKPAEVVARAYAVHSRAEVDRRYRLTAELPGQSHGADLWTRGDRFRVAPGPAGGVWGQDGDGRVWVAPSPKAGVRFDEDEVPDRLRAALLLRAADLPDLLTELRGTCELERRDLAGGGVAVEARRVRGDSSLARASLEIDGRTGGIGRLRAWRELPGGSEGTLTLTLEETGEKPDAFYTLEGNLAPGGEAIDRTRPGQRLALLVRHGLGALIGK
ncbi:MAG: hypothetical protein ACRC33_18245, partial [Gemmataceae bacterium]